MFVLSLRDLKAAFDTEQRLSHFVTNDEFKYVLNRFTSLILHSQDDAKSGNGEK